MEKKVQIVVVVSVIVAFLIGLSVGQWYAGYRIERQVDKVTEDFEDYMDDLTGGDGEFDEQDILDMYDLDGLTDQIIDDLPSGDLGCSANGVEYSDGEGYFDGCNSCGCNDGDWVCTEKACEGVDTAE